MDRARRGNGGDYSGTVAPHTILPVGDKQKNSDNVTRRPAPVVRIKKTAPTGTRESHGRRAGPTEISIVGVRAIIKTESSDENRFSGRARRCHPTTAAADGNKRIPYLFDLSTRDPCILICGPHVQVQKNVVDHVSTCTAASLLIERILIG